MSEIIPKNRPHKLRQRFSNSRLLGWIVNTHEDAVQNFPESKSDNVPKSLILTDLIEKVKGYFQGASHGIAEHKVTDVPIQETARIRKNAGLGLETLLQGIVYDLVDALGYTAAMVATYEPDDSLPVRAFYIDPQIASSEQIETWEKIVSGIKGKPVSIADPQIARVFRYKDEFKDNLCIKAIEAGKPIFSDQLYTLFTPMGPSASRSIIAAIQEALGIQQVIAVPLFLIDSQDTQSPKKEVAGVLVVASRLKTLYDKDVKLLEVISQQVITGIWNIRLLESYQKTEELYRESEARRQVAQTFAKMAFFANTAIHDLNNAIGLINTSIHLVNPPLDFEQDAVKTMVQGIENAGNLIQELADPFRPIPEEAVDINSAIERAVRKVEKLGHVVIKNCEPNLPQVIGSYPILVEIFRVFFKNGLEAIQEAGTQGDLTVSSTYDQDEGYIVVTIHDTGVGIEADHLSHIFDFKWTTKKAKGGLGFGLFWAKDAVENMGGAIEVSSTVGWGTTFRILLPVKDAEAALTKHSAVRNLKKADRDLRDTTNNENIPTVRSPALEIVSSKTEERHIIIGKVKTMLIVEDDEHWKDILTELCQKAHKKIYDVIGNIVYASSSQGAIEEITKRSIHFASININLQGDEKHTNYSDGLQILSEIYNKKLNVAFTVVSGENEPHFASISKKYGALTFQQKGNSHLFAIYPTIVEAALLYTEATELFDRGIYKSSLAKWREAKDVVKSMEEKVYGVGDWTFPRNIEKELQIRFTHPVTHLPTSRLIEDEFAKIVTKDHWILFYIEITNLDAFTTSQGLIQTEALLIDTRNLIQEAVGRQISNEFFLGQTSDNIFVVISDTLNLSYMKIKDLIEYIKERFDQYSLPHYDFRSREQGAMEYEDRDGNWCRAPFASLDCGMVKGKKGEFAKGQLNSNGDIIFEDAQYGDITDIDRTARQALRASFNSESERVRTRSEIKRRVLVIDDSETWCRAIALLLKTNGYEAVEARDLITAKAALDNQKFDIVTIDMQFEKQSSLGEVILKFIRKKYPTIACIIISGAVRSFAEVDNLKDMYGLGAFVHKAELTPTRLRKAIEQAEKFMEKEQ